VRASRESRAMSGWDAVDERVSILLVDDQEAERVALEVTLEPMGQRLVHAKSGREALRLLLHQDFALVLMDVVMPDMDGFETAQLIHERERSRHTPILFLTGLSRGQMPELRAYAVGVVDFLHKPYEPEILRSKVRVFVDLFRKTEMVRRQGEALRQAQQAARLRDDFLSRVGHELKAPLTALEVHLQGALREAARREEPVPLAQHVAKLETLERNVAQLARQVEGLLDVSHPHTGRLAPGEVDLAEVVREVAARFAQEAARARCSLTVRAEHAVVGPWDRARVEQVVTNLLSNALQYGAGQPVELVVGAADGQAMLEVRDRGLGIAEENHPRIFERFERAASHGTVAGFGLGLWLVRQIVNGLGGTVGVESTPGQGSAFRVALPCAGQPRAEDVRRAAGAWKG